MSVIAAFPATGKTYLAERASGVADSDSSAFSWKWLGPEDRVRHPDWPGNYMAHIRAALGDGQTVLVSTHAEVRDALYEAGIYFVLVYPERGLRSEYRERMLRRGSPGPLVDGVMELWTSALDRLDVQRGCDHLILGAGRYLADVFATGSDPPRITDEMEDRMALWLLNYDTRGVLTSFAGLPELYRLKCEQAHAALEAALDPSPRPQESK